MTSRVFGDGDRLQFNNDILTCLIEVMPNKPLARFAQTCRSIHALARATLRERELIAVYTTIYINELNPLHLVETLRQRPETTKYITNVSVSIGIAPDVVRAVRSTQNPDDQGSSDDDDNTTDFLLQQATTLPYMSDRLHNKLQTAIQTRDYIDNDIVMTATMLCANVKTFSYDGPLPTLTHSMTPVSSYLHNHDREDMYRYTDADKSNHRLPRITTLDLWDTTRAHRHSGKIEFNDVLTLLTLPSLSIFCLGRVEFRQTPRNAPVPHATAAALRTSNVTRIALTRCDVAPRLLLALFTHVPSLVKLEYDDVRDYSNYGTLADALYDESSRAYANERDKRIDAYLQMLTTNYVLSGGVRGCTFGSASATMGRAALRPSLPVVVIDRFVDP